MHSQPNLVELVNFIIAVFSSDPPIATGVGAHMMAGGSQSHFP